MNKFQFALIFLVALSPGVAIAQDSFLKLDSIVVIDNPLSTNKVSGRSYDYEGHDTIAIGAGADQIVKMRYCSITLKRASTSFGTKLTAEEFSSNSTLYDMRILSSSGHNFFDITNLAMNTSKGYYQGSGWYKYAGSPSSTFGQHTNQFISPGEEIIISYVQQWYQRSYYISYRLELLYFSYE